jgi:hypothetical protein
MQVCSLHSHIFCQSQCSICPIIDLHPRYQVALCPPAVPSQSSSNSEQAWCCVLRATGPILYCVPQHAGLLVGGADLGEELGEEWAVLCGRHENTDISRIDLSRTASVSAMCSRDDRISCVRYASGMRQVCVRYASGMRKVCVGYASGAISGGSTPRRRTTPCTGPSSSSSSTYPS